jgi:hypothetical protein
MTRLALFAALAAVALAACDKLPDRPDEAKYRAADDMEKCRLTAARAILCTDELMVAEIRAMPGLEGSDGFADEMRNKLASEPKRMPKQERREAITLHKTRCRGDRKTDYQDAVFSCWAIEDCTRFAECVMKPSTGAPNKPSTGAPNTPSTGAPNKPSADGT